MKRFLCPEDKDAFLDFPNKNKKPIWGTDFVECPLCFGHGGWNLELNAYNLHDKENTAENRHRYAHFRASCSQCNGYGWVSPLNTKCIHSWERTIKTGNCLHIFKCSKCNASQEIDSSG